MVVMARSTSSLSNIESINGLRFTLTSIESLGYTDVTRLRRNGRIVSAVSSEAPMTIPPCTLLYIRDVRSEEHTSELQSHRDLHSFPTRRSSDLHRRHAAEKERQDRVCGVVRSPDDNSALHIAIHKGRAGFIVKTQYFSRVSQQLDTVLSQ